MRKRKRLNRLFLSNILVFILVLSVFSSFGFAQETTTETVNIATGVDTIIVVNSGDVSTVDAAIAAGISADTGIPVLYVEHDDASKVIEELKTTYGDVKDVIILGGEAVVSSDVQKFLETSGALSDYEVTRIAGTTGTGTAVEAIDYFYGPGMLSDTGITIVAYGGDYEYKDYNEVLNLAAELGKPIIPVPVADINGDSLGGLPAEVVETLEINKIDSVELVGDFQGRGETEVKNDLQEIGATVNNEINGDNLEQIEGQLQEEIINNIQPRENVEITFVQKGDIPPISGDENNLVFYYKDENHDNIDDDSGAVLDGIGRGLYDEITAKGANVEGITCTGDDPNVWGNFKAEMEKRGEKVDLVEYNDENIVDVSLGIHNDHADDISDRYGEKSEMWSDLIDEHKQEFAAALPSMIEQFKAFYATLDKEKLSPRATELAAQIIDQANKGDPVSEWALMNAFASEERHEEYAETCHEDDACRNGEIEAEQENTDDKLEKLVGTERAREVANLDVGEKVGLLSIDDFTPPGQEEKLAQDVSNVLAQGTSVDSLPSDFINEKKEEAYRKYAEEFRKEYKALGKTEEAAKWTPERAKAEFDKRITLESEAYLSGVVGHDEFADPARRAEAFAKMEEMRKEFESKGVQDSYLTPQDWKAAYGKYNTEGKISEEDIKYYGVAADAYKTWEQDHAGIYQNPSNSYYDSKTGAFSFTDHEGKVVTGIHDEKTGAYTYTNEKGELVQGYRDGRFNEYHSDYGGWKYDSEKGLWTGPKGETYTPPSVYNAVTGTYDYHPPTGDHPEGYVVSCGSKGCEGGIYNGPGSTWTPPSGWKQEGDKWISPEGKEYSGSTSYYSSSGTSGTTKDASGNTWTQNPDGTWSSSSGATYSGHEGSYSYSPPSGSEGSYSGGSYYSGGAYSGGSYSGYSGSYSGSTGTYSGGSYSAPSGGDSGSYSAPPSGYAVYDSGYTRGLLSKWLFG